MKFFQFQKYFEEGIFLTKRRHASRSTATHRKFQKFLRFKNIFLTNASHDHLSAIALAIVTM